MHTPVFAPLLLRMIYATKLPGRFAARGYPPNTPTFYKYTLCQIGTNLYLRIKKAILYGQLLTLCQAGRKLNFIYLLYHRSLFYRKHHLMLQLILLPSSLYHPTLFIHYYKHCNDSNKKKRKY